jgi:hypothetical protein
LTPTGNVPEDIVVKGRCHGCHVTASMAFVLSHKEAFVRMQWALLSAALEASDTATKATISRGLVTT